MVEPLPTRADLQKGANAVAVELVARYSSGETVKALAAEFCMHHQTVREVLCEAGVVVRTRQRLTSQQLREIERLYADGASTSELGARFGVAASTVGRALIRRGVVLRPPGWRPSQEQN